MIEVEKKFILDEDIKNKIISGAEFLHKKTFTDTYYDDVEFSLTSKDMWLRCRDNKFELKIPASISDESSINQYRELNDNSEIADFLHLSKNDDLGKEFNNRGFKPFCALTTTREKYKRGLFSIDIDIVSAEDFDYSIAEVELEVEKDADMENALNKIRLFMSENGISESTIRGKVIEYLRLKNPIHYEILLSAGVIKETEPKLPMKFSCR